MDKWEAITGVILFLVGAAVAWQNYNTVTGCNTFGGKLSTAITSLFGGTGAQSCYNAQIAVVGGILVALIGLVIIYFAYQKGSRRR